MLFDIGYGLSAIGYLLLVFLLLVVRKPGLAKSLLLTATIATCVWAVVHISSLGWITEYRHFAQIDSVRMWIWVLFLAACLQNQFSSFWQLVIRPVTLGILTLPSLAIVVSLSNVFSNSVTYLLFTLVTIQILVLLEQVYRQAAKHKWEYKPLVIYLGALATFDFFSYANAAMVNQLNWIFLEARGYIYVALLPFLILAIRRIQHWGIDIFVSREVVMHSTLLMLSGAYLVVMAMLGYIVKFFGGEWGAPVQIVLFLIAIVLLASLFLSHEFRTKLKVFITKHFYANQFDYRVEWVALTKALSAEGKTLPEIYSCALAGWMQGIKYDQGCLIKTSGAIPIVVAQLNNTDYEQATTPNYLHELTLFLEKKAWIVDFNEMQSKPELYDEMLNRNKMIGNGEYQIVVPIFERKALWGMVMLNARDLEKRSLNWELRDYLRAVTEQTANFIFQAESSNALAENAQFAAFNRMSAFVAHDLKNVLAQINLLLTNAEKHKSNPEFIDDTFETLEHTKSRMDKMLKQLMDKSMDQRQKLNEVDISQIAAHVIETKCLSLLPLPILIADAPIRVSLDSDKLANVLYHLISNAQQASADSGEVTVKVRSKENAAQTMAVIDIMDNGEGMSVSFVQTKLFKPFETTKGNAGMGVGAYDAKTYIESIGGSISVSSEVGKGSCFSLYIPLY